MIDLSAINAATSALQDTIAVPEPRTDEERAHAAVERGLRAASAPEAKLTGQQRQKLQALLKEGIKQYNAGQYEQCIDTFDKALAIDSHECVALSNCGMAQAKAGRPLQSIETLTHAISLAPHLAQVHNGLGLAYANLLLWEKAVECYDEALKINPNLISALVNRSTALKHLGRRPEALQQLETALKLDPKSFAARVARANMHVNDNRYAEALADFEALPPEYRYSNALNYANSLLRTGNPRQALDVLEQHPSTGEDEHSCLISKSACETLLGMFAQAYTSLSKAIELKPDHSFGYWNLSMVLLAIGEFDLGWELYEHRFHGNKQVSLSFPPYPRWKGDDSLEGKSIYIQHEQGLGDSIQFSRYALLLEEMGATVTLETKAPLKPLLDTLSPSIKVITKEDWTQPQDFTIPLMSLPMALKTRLDTVPAADRYVYADPDRVEHWRAKLGEKSGLRVGIAWSGSPGHANDAMRSIPFSHLDHLLATANATFHVLHKGLREGEREAAQQYPNVHVWEDEIEDFGDTAALMELVDVVVTVDTSIAHLAGALGRPTCVMLSIAQDFRWLTNRDDSPWYPSMTLFRQDSLGDWDGVIRRLRTALEHPSVQSAAGVPVEVAEEAAVEATALEATTDEQSVESHASPEPGTQQASSPRAGGSLCKVCEAETDLCGVVDFSKNCEERRGTYLPMAGVPIYYRQCQSCRLLFSQAFDDWTSEDFALNIYNEDYIKVDPDYKLHRPEALAQTVGDFAKQAKAKRILDYGGGEGLMAKLLRDKGKKCDSWDPFGAASDTPKLGHYDLVTSFEVFEHTPTPVKTLAEILSYVKPDGAVLFSTLTLNNLPKRDLSHWYIGPRNGHITIHTRQSLKALFERFGWQLHHFSDGMHLAFKTRPAYLPAA